MPESLDERERYENGNLGRDLPEALVLVMADMVLAQEIES